MSALSTFFNSLAGSIRKILGQDVSVKYSPQKMLDTLAEITPQGAVSATLNCDGSYAIPKGYHNGNGKITANSLANQTKVDADKTAVAAAQMLSGYEGYVNGSKIDGTMPNQGTKTYTINPGGKQVIPAGYHNGSGYVQANPNQNSGTYKPTSRANNLDMGVNNANRYVDTTAVPNTNAATYTFPANHTGGNVDLGVTNSYRYVNAANVYNKGKIDAFNPSYINSYDFYNLIGSLPNYSISKVIEYPIKKTNMYFYLYLDASTSSDYKEMSVIIKNKNNNSVVYQKRSGEDFKREGFCISTGGILSSAEIASFVKYPLRIEISAQSITEYNPLTIASAAIEI